MKRHNPLLSGPYLIWTAAFIIIPLLMILYYGLTDKSGAFTWSNVAQMGTPERMKALIRTMSLSRQMLIQTSAPSPSTATLQAIPLLLTTCPTELPC